MWAGMVVVGDSRDPGEEMTVKDPKARFPRPDVSSGQMTEASWSV
jgi:hypothetical protein